MGAAVDYAFEVFGLTATMRQAHDCLAKRGMAVVVGVSIVHNHGSVALSVL